MYANLANTPDSIDTGMDSIVIVNHLEGIPGGKVLDTTGFDPTVIKAGHVIIKNASDVYKPLPVSGTLPASHTIEGILVSSILTAKPFAAVMVRGTVNVVASPYPAHITSDVKTALPLIRFVDESK